MCLWRAGGVEQEAELWRAENTNQARHMTRLYCNTPGRITNNLINSRPTNQPTANLLASILHPANHLFADQLPQTGAGAGVDTAAATMLSFLRRAALQGTAASVQRTTAGHLLFTLPASAKPAATNSLPVLFTQTNHELISFLTLHYLSSQYRSLVFNQMFC